MYRSNAHRKLCRVSYRDEKYWSKSGEVHELAYTSLNLDEERAFVLLAMDCTSTVHGTTYSSASSSRRGFATRPLRAA